MLSTDPERCVTILKVMPGNKMFSPKSIYSLNNIFVSALGETRCVLVSCISNVHDQPLSTLNLKLSETCYPACFLWQMKFNSSASILATILVVVTGVQNYVVLSKRLVSKKRAKNRDIQWRETFFQSRFAAACNLNSSLKDYNV